MKAAENKDTAQLVEMMKGVKTCMMMTGDKKGGSLSGRPMGLTKVEADGSMWFFTKSMSLKVEELEDNKEVAIAILNEDSNNYLMINGEAGLVYEKEKMKELWSPVMKAWFPDGVDEPGLVLIKVTPVEVKYWDSSSSKMVILFNMLKAIVTGKVYDEGEHGSINL
jgi:general stress protein 26